MPERLITSAGFKGKFIKKLPPDFQWQKTPLQLYPLSFISRYIYVPTPLLQPDFYSLVYLHSGHFTQKIGTDTFEIKAPAVVLIPLGTIHALESISGDMRGYFVLIENKTMSAICNEEDTLKLFTINPILQINDHENTWFKSITRLLYKEVTGEKPNRKIGHALLQALLYKVLEISQSSRKLSRQQSIALRFRSLVYAHFKTEKNVGYYASALAVSENYLGRCVQSVFNKSPKEIIIETAILNSQLIMWDTNQDIARICFELNFDDPSYFSRLFKRVTGQTPTEYKRQILQDLS